VALWNGWKVVRFAPGGGIDVVVDVAASHVTSVMFGGPDLEDLYITCAWSELSDAQRASEPHAGSLFKVRPGFRGYPAVEFAG
jgi:sugar lactone lactonase YvrE